MTNETSSLPLIVTMGEPAGIGADIVLSAFQQSAQLSLRAFGVIGCAAALRRRAQLTGQTAVEVIPISHASQIQDAFKRGLPVLDRPLPHEPQPGVPSSQSAATVIEWVDSAVKLALAGEVLRREAKQNYYVN